MNQQEQTMSTPENQITSRIASLERQVRVFQICLMVAFCSALVAALWSVVVQAQDDRVLRVRGLVVEDVMGRDRIVIGAPLPTPGRISPSTGMAINDPQGVERFGLGLLDNGRVVMGFDAPPGTGDDRNRERISIVSEANGGAYIRFLNRKTLIPGRLVLDPDDQMYLEFYDTRDGKTMAKKVGFAGERIVEVK
jgi:hypothetical protein